MTDRVRADLDTPEHVDPVAVMRATLAAHKPKQPLKRETEIRVKRGYRVNPQGDWEPQK